MVLGQMRAAYVQLTFLGQAVSIKEHNFVGRSLKNLQGVIIHY
jgi:hypothetical protein